MSDSAFHEFLRLERVRAAMVFELDEVLSTQHGIAWSDFLLMHCLDASARQLAATELAASLGLRPARLLLQVLPLEKVGLIERQVVAGRRGLQLRPSGRRLLAEARETAAAICEKRWNARAISPP